MRFPSANEICEDFPKNQWFRIPVEVDRIFPDISPWDRSVVLTKGWWLLNALLAILNRTIFS